MSVRQDTAAARYEGGLNCAQAVLSVFCEDYGLAPETANRLACGLGGGFRSGEICGAAAGAALAIGLRYGPKSEEDRDAKAECYEKTGEYIQEFRRRNGTVLCRDLLGGNVSDAGFYAEARREGRFRATCPDIIRCAVGLLEEMGY